MSPALCAECHPPRIGLPSEDIEPLLAGTFSWYLRDYAGSEYKAEDDAVLLGCVKVISRMTILNHGSGINGVHASIAANNLTGMVHDLLGMPVDERRSFLTKITSEAGLEQPPL